jgi:chemotaxis protein MotA
MDLATIIGLVLSIILVGTAIGLGGNPTMFVDITSLMIVIGGTFGATFMRNPMSQVFGTARVVARAFTTQIPPPDGLIGEVLELSRKARKEGVLALEGAELKYDFFSKEEEMRSILETDMRATAQRHLRGQEILQGMGQAAPAFGMIGTLIGLVQMLASMSDPSQIGPAMALALLTTLYGALISNVLCLPLADKLRVRAQEEQLSMRVCLEGVIGIGHGVNPSSLDQQLQCFIAPKSRLEKKAA